MKLLIQAISDNDSECWKIVDLPIVPRVGDQFWPQVEIGFDGNMEVVRVCVYEHGLVVVECSLSRSPFPWREFGWSEGDWIDTLSEESASELVR